MKIAPKAAEAFIAKPDAGCRALLLYGPDAGLVRDRASRARGTILGTNPDPFSYVEFDEAKLLADPALLADELSAIGLMGGKRLIFIRDAGDKLRSVVEGAMPAFHDAVFLLIAAGELSSRSTLRALFEKEPQCATVACYRDEVRDVIGVIRKRLEEEDVKLEQGGIDYLASLLGNDRYVTYQELEKIITYAGPGGTVSVEELGRLVDYNRETSLDDLVTASADRNVRGLERMLDAHLKEGTSPVAYLRALSRYFNRLYFIRSRMAQGESAESVIQGLRPPVFFKQLPALTRHVQQWELPAITRALKLLIEAELACKTSDLPPVPASSRKLFQVTQLR